MDLDNSMAVAFRTCPYMYQEKYENKLERIWTKPGEISSLAFGTRVHELLEEHYKDLMGTPIPPYPESEIPALELEAQAMFASYCNHYPVEPFHIVDVERTFKVPLNDRHNALGKFDVVFEDPESDALIVMDHKTEKRNGRRNLPQTWAARSQASIYFYAAEKLYGRPIRHLLLNMLTRQSPKGQEAPTFPPRQTIQRSRAQIDLAVRDIIVVADTIEEYRQKFGNEPWPSSTENCCVNGWECDFYAPHVFGWSDELLKLYQPTKPYLDL